MQPLEDAYRVLGISTSATNAEVKKAYRRLTNQHHPDKLVAKGMPEEMVKLANEKTQEIRSAWERVRDDRAAQH
jgi:DnaJ like chaperone protein